MLPEEGAFKRGQLSSIWEDGEQLGTVASCREAPGTGPHSQAAADPSTMGTEGDELSLEGKDAPETDLRGHQEGSPW